VSATRILIVEDSQEWRDLFSDLLRQERSFEVVGQASDGLAAIPLAELTKPTVVVLDINMPRLDGIEAARRIRALCPETKIVFVSGENDQDVIDNALLVGSSGYVSKPRVWRDLVVAIRSVLRGKPFVSPRLDVAELGEQSEMQGV
jgi:DNA-binding NarL/FixJ family response regulator